MNTSQTQIAEALRLARAGDLAAAERICKEVVKREPSNFSAMMLLGIVAASRGQPDQAAPLFERVIARQPQRADAHFNLGLVRVRQGREADAVICFERTLAIDPANLEAAVARVEALLALWRWREAVPAIDDILARHPDLADLWLKRGAALDTLAEYGEALQSYRRAEQLSPDNPVTHHLIGAILVRGGSYRAAIGSLSKSMSLGLHNAETYLQRALAYSKLGDVDKAIKDFARAHEIAPADRRILIYYAECLQRADRVADAEAMLQRARERSPVDANIILGNMLSDRRRDAEAMAAFDEAATRDPNEYLAVWARTLHQLRLGNLEAGLRDFDARLRGPIGATGNALPGPDWQPGTGQADHKLFLYAEQGFGDTINFARYIPLLIAQGHEVVLQVQPPLVTLCRSLHANLTVVDPSEPVPLFDARAPLPSLPARLRATLETIPARVPYLQPTPAASAAWQARTAGLKQPRVGLCWAGSLTHERDAARSIRFADLKGLFAIDGVSFVNLQHDTRPEEKPEVAAEIGFDDFTTSLADFNETAALIQALDLVITVDTAVAHLAGALAKPVWILIADAPDWRWMWDRSDSPWYPTARLFRQTRYGDWSDVIERVKSELLSSFPAPSSRP
jgi:tetratricopeptide (TPR) repeat protein